MNRSEITNLLQKNDFRATKGRIDVISFLQKQKHPVGIELIAKNHPNINQATIYRMMTDFVATGLVHTHDLGHGHLDYEIANKPHHHHAVCEQCGFIEDIYNCKEACEFQTSVQKASKHFAEIHAPNVTLFGICKTCHKKL